MRGAWAHGMPHLKQSLVFAPELRRVLLDGFHRKTGEEGGQADFHLFETQPAVIEVGQNEVVVGLVASGDEAEGDAVGVEVVQAQVGRRTVDGTVAFFETVGQRDQVAGGLVEHGDAQLVGDGVHRLIEGFPVVGGDLGTAFDLLDPRTPALEEMRRLADEVETSGAGEGRVEPGEKPARSPNCIVRPFPMCCGSNWICSSVNF